MSVEARVRVGQSLAEALSFSADQARKRLGKIARIKQEKLAGIVDPPYNTPDGKPLEVRFYKPGEGVLFNKTQTRELICQINRLSKKD